ncbi:hypothetical protein E2320_022766, partial [Naja naja]
MQRSSTHFTNLPRVLPSPRQCHEGPVCGLFRVGTEGRLRGLGVQSVPQTPEDVHAVCYFFQKKPKKDCRFRLTCFTCHRYVCPVVNFDTFHLKKESLPRMGQCHIPLYRWSACRELTDALTLMMTPPPLLPLS